jgi:hypothetical protein
MVGSEGLHQPGLRSGWLIFAEQAVFLDGFVDDGDASAAHARHLKRLDAALKGIHLT